MIDPNASIALSAALFGLGILGVFVRRSPISLLLSLQLMLAASVLALVSFDLTTSVSPGRAEIAQMLVEQHVGRSTGKSTGKSAGNTAGQGFGVLILSVATAQVTIGLGLMIAGRREPSEGAAGSSQ